MQPFVQGRLTTQLSGNEKEHLEVFKDACGPDLEAILGELDGITALKSNASISVFSKGRYFTIEKAGAANLRTAIEYQVIQEYSAVPEAELSKLYSPLFDVLFSRLDESKHCLPIFTTNYDPAIENFCALNSDRYQLTDGFRNVAATREYIWDPAQFATYELTPGKRNLVLFKLHGSVDWLLVRARNTIVRSAPFHQMVDPAKYGNVLIYPAMNKVATIEPYYTAYDYFGRCCERSKLCLVIGYSFRDYDALTRLRSAAFINPDLRLSLLSADADKIIYTLGPLRPLFSTLQFLFGHNQNTPLYLAAILKLLPTLEH